MENKLSPEQWHGGLLSCLPCALVHLRVYIVLGNYMFTSELLNLLGRRFDPLFLPIIQYLNGAVNQILVVSYCQYHRFVKSGCAQNGFSN